MTRPPLTIRREFLGDREAMLAACALALTWDPAPAEQPAEVEAREAAAAEAAEREQP